MKREIERRFLALLDGSYGFEKAQYVPTSYALGICHLEFEDNCLHVHLRRPGLLIGEKGTTVGKLEKELDLRIRIHEVDLNLGKTELVSPSEVEKLIKLKDDLIETYKLSLDNVNKIVEKYENK